MADDFPNWNRRVEERQAASKKLSELVREVALGGIAVVWAFLVGEIAVDDVTFIKTSFLALLLFVLVFIAEFIQYFGRMVYLWNLSRRIWKDAGQKHEIAERMALEKGYPRTFGYWITQGAFVTKQVLVVGALGVFGFALLRLWLTF